MTLSLEAMSADINRPQTDHKPTTNDNEPPANHPQTTHEPPTNEQHRILKNLLDGEKPIGSLMEVCEYKDKRSFRKSVLNEMLDSELVAMTHPENPNHKKQRYVITEKGRKIIEESSNL